MPKWTGPVLATAIPFALAVYLAASGHDPRWAIPVSHFLIVTVALLLAGVFALVLGVAGGRQRNVQVTFISLAFSTLAFLSMLHGLATPGIILSDNPVIGVSSHLSLAGAGLWLSLSTLPSSHPLVGWLSRRQGTLVAVWNGLLLAVVAWGLLRPESWSVLVATSPSAQWSVGAGVSLLLGFSAVQYWRAYSYSKMPLAGAMAYACGWLLASEWIVVTTEIWHASWWIYHVLLVAAIVALLVGVARQYAGSASLSNITRGLFIADPVEQIEVGLSEGVRALVRATEAHDSYTGGHSYRVALTAIRIGQRMGLPAVDLRALAQGGLVHDVGKMEIPDRVLNKEGSLSEEEMELVRQHPEAGYRMCQNLGFMQEELEIVRYHHERYDGSGYPDGFAGEEIPVHARILAVADVYDALTSERSYRESWSHARARQWILKERGGKFGPACVDAWSSLTEEGPVVEAAEQPGWTTGVTAPV